MLQIDGFVKLAELCERTSDDYIIELGYDDWCAPHHIKKCSASVINTAYLHMMFKLVADIGRVIGKSETLCKEYEKKRNWSKRHGAKDFGWEVHGRSGMKIKPFMRWRYTMI